MVLMRKDVLYECVQTYVMKRKEDPYALFTRSLRTRKFNFSCCAGTVDKFSALTTLDDSDYDIINDPSGWLTCGIVQAVQVLLQEVNPVLEGLQRPTLGRVRNFDVVSGEFLQILHTGSDHWVCVSSIGCLPGKVHLYDSLFHDVISQEIEGQTNDLLGGNLGELHFVPVQQQTNNSDCGVFAIAFAFESDCDCV